MQTHKFSLDNNYYIVIEKNDEGKHIYMVDSVLNDKKLMGTLNTNHKWIFPSPQISQDFFKMVRKYESIFMNNFYKPMEEIHEITFNKRFKCFQRRMWVSVGRTLNKLKYGI